MAVTINEGLLYEKTGPGESDKQLYYPRTSWNNVVEKPSWLDSDTKPSYAWDEISDKPNLVTLDTEQTITAKKRFQTGTDYTEINGGSLYIYKRTGGVSWQSVIMSNDRISRHWINSSDPNASPDVTQHFLFPVGVSGTIALTSDITWDNVASSAPDFVLSSQIGVAGGVASLDKDGRVPSSQLPGFVDDVEEYANKAAFPEEGESGKIYVAKDTNLTYRWGGTEYVEISPSLALGETSATAYPGDKGKANADAIKKLETSLGDYAKTSDLDDYVTLGTQQTITEKKFFSKGIIIGTLTNGFEFSDGSIARLEGTSAYPITVRPMGGTLALLSDIKPIPESLPPTGNAGGDLSGTYPNPTIKAGAVNDTKLSKTGVSAGYYSTVQVNEQGRVVDGAYIFMSGKEETIPEQLAVGGLYFQITSSRSA